MRRGRPTAQAAGCAGTVALPGAGRQAPAREPTGADGMRAPSRSGSSGHGRRPGQGCREWRFTGARRQRKGATTELAGRRRTRVTVAPETLSHVAATGESSQAAGPRPGEIRRGLSAGGRNTDMGENPPRGCAIGDEGDDPRFLGRTSEETERTPCQQPLELSRPALCSA